MKRQKSHPACSYPRASCRKGKSSAGTDGHKAVWINRNVSVNTARKFIHYLEGFRQLLTEGEK